MQRSEVILLDECSFQGRLKAGLCQPAGVASPNAQDNPSPFEFRVYAEHRQFTEQCACSGSWNCSA
ncbi:MAG: hypothetical protein GX456_16925 [Verrucomicrobia bacterium]|nr:hypothetical protein [Verrucomicrobiota bacterium]